MWLQETRGFTMFEQDPAFNASTLKKLRGSRQQMQGGIYHQLFMFFTLRICVSIFSHSLLPPTGLLIHINSNSDANSGCIRGGAARMPIPLSFHAKPTAAPVLSLYLFAAYELI